MEENLKNWPPIEGRYKVGNKRSPIAVCTNATVEGIELDLEKVAIIGKCVTENIGIEKMIQNIISNPYLRFLILCGKTSKGHFVGQAIISLKKNGIDRDKRIIGARGNMPFLKGINESLVERFRKQIQIVDLMQETDSKKIMEKVEECLKEESKAFQEEPIKIDKVEEIEARACPEWIPDPKGFFVIFLDRKRKRITAEHYHENKLRHKITGNSAKDISETIANLDLIGDFPQTKEHAMYLARELQKAEIALQNDLDYEQDGDLKIKRVKQKANQPADEYDWFD